MFKANKNDNWLFNSVNPILSCKASSSFKTLDDIADADERFKKSNRGDILDILFLHTDVKYCKSNTYLPFTAVIQTMEGFEIINSTFDLSKLRTDRRVFKCDDNRINIDYDGLPKFRSLMTSLSNAPREGFCADKRDKVIFRAVEQACPEFKMFIASKGAIIPERLRLKNLQAARAADYSEMINYGRF